MSNFICYICKVNKPFKGYSGTELLDEEGNKPCMECHLENESSKEEEQDE